MPLLNKQTLNHLSDSELIAKILAGNQQAIVYLFYDKCAALFGYISATTFHGKVTKEELISELFIYLQEKNWHRLRTFKGDNCKLTTWISVVAVRFFNQRRTLVIDSTSELPLNNNNEAFELYSKAHEKFIAEIDIHNAISRMKNNRYKYVVIALELEDRKPNDVANELGITVDNLYNIRVRALNQLGRIIKGKRNAN